MTSPTSPGRLTVVRHSQSAYNAAGIWAGWADPDLTARGRADAVLAAGTWAERGVDLVISSDLRRAADGADIIAAELGVRRGVRDRRLRERNAGRWQRTRKGQLEGDERYAAWLADPTVRPPGGEGWEEFTRRLSEAVAEHVPPSGHTLAVTHDGVLQALSIIHRVDAHPARALTEGITFNISENGALAAARLRGWSGWEEGCDICRIISGGTHPAGPVVHHGRHVVVNHYLPEAEGDRERPGWFVVSPVRHLRRWHQLDDAETAAIADATRAVDAALTCHTGSRRTMISSLGWDTDAHLHVHCVPTFREDVTEGYLNFDGRYEGEGVPADIADRVRASLLQALGPDREG